MQGFYLHMDTLSLPIYALFVILLWYSLTYLYYYPAFLNQCNYSFCNRFIKLCSSALLKFTNNIILITMLSVTSVRIHRIK